MGAPWPSCPCPSYLNTNNDSSSPLYLTPGNKVRTYMNPSVSNKFPQSQPFSLQVKSPQAKSFIYCSKYRLESHTIFIKVTPPFLAPCVRSKRTFFISAATLDYPEPILLHRFVDQHQKQKHKNLGVTMLPLPLNTTRNLHPCHFTTLPPFPTCHLTTLSPFPTCHLTTL